MALNILIVDDSAVMRAMIEKTLHMTDVSLGEIHQAANGQEGLEKLDRHWIDLAIVDINMPVMNGEEMINCMRENSATKDIPIVVVSTEGSTSRIESLQKQGARFIHKPFSPEMIRDTIEEITGDLVAHDRTS